MGFISGVIKIKTWGKMVADSLIIICWSKSGLPWSSPASYLWPSGPGSSAPAVTPSGGWGSRFGWTLPCYSSTDSASVELPCNSSKEGPPRSAVAQPPQLQARAWLCGRYPGVAPDEEGVGAPGLSSAHSSKVHWKMQLSKTCPCVEVLGAVI